MLFYLKPVLNPNDKIFFCTYLKLLDVFMLRKKYERYMMLTKTCLSS